jgi:hypothetical protein
MSRNTDEAKLTDLLKVLNDRGVPKSVTSDFMAALTRFGKSLGPIDDGALFATVVEFVIGYGFGRYGGDRTREVVRQAINNREAGTS